MADILEIIDKVVAISKGIYGIVKNINGAPVELRALDREVSRIIPILEHLFDTLGNRAKEENRNRDTKALQSLCDEARELVDRANGFVKTNVNGTYKLSKKEWPRWLMKKSDREELVKRFHDLYNSASAYLSCDGRRDQGQMSGEINAQSVRLQAIQHKIQEMDDNVSAIRLDIARHQEQMHYAIVQCAMRSAAESQTQDLNQYYDQVTADGAGSTDLKINSESSTRITCNRTSGSDRCPPSCRCRCHIPLISLVPQFLRSVAGCLFVQHDWLSSLVSARTPCNDRGCKRHRSNLLKIKYHCPAWFAHINAEIRTECIPVHFCIQTQRVVMDLGWLEFATLDTVKQKLSNRELAVNDVQSNGVTVLHPLMWRSTVDRSETALSILDLLTEHSAVMEWEYEGQTPIEFALWWSLVYWRLFGSRKAAINIFKFRLGPYLSLDIEDVWKVFATKLGWTELHRRICLPFLSLSSPLTSVPRELTSYVNVQDSLGRTPLFYAALVSPEAVHALLHAGANPITVPDILTWAARAGADTVISVLVRAGAHINTYDPDGTTALHRAVDPSLLCSIKPFAVALELIRHAGYLLDWNMRDDDGDTPLNKAQIRSSRNPTDEDSKQILELYLTHRLPHGAQYIPSPPTVSAKDELDELDKTSLPMTSLIRAGLQGDTNAIEGLIQQGAMVNERDSEGRTLLHLVASGQVPDGYGVALQLVRNGGWGVDWKARTGAGETALDIIQRTLAHNGLTEAERKEAMKIHTLLRARRLPPDAVYIWPCMDPDFYPPHVPGAWIC